MLILGIQPIDSIGITHTYFSDQNQTVSCDDLPYSAKFSMVIIFAVFANLVCSAKIFNLKIKSAHYAKCTA